MEKNKGLGLLLKEYREKKFPGMGLRRVAIEVGLDYSHLFRIEAGQYIPSDENLLKLLNAYDISALEKLNLFNLARITPSHRDLIEEVQKAEGELVFARTNKTFNDPTNPKQ